MRHVVSAVALLLGAASCGGSSGSGAAFANDWQHDGGRSITEVQKRLAASPLPESPGVVVGVTSDGLVGMGLDGSDRWERPISLDARPDVAGQVVVGTGGGQLFCLEARTGRELWRVSAEGRRLRGAGDDGKVTVASLGAPSGGQSLFVAIDRSGKVLRRLEPQVDIGVPGVLGGVALVPWGNQYVSAIDLATGEEIGRLLTRMVVSQADAIGGTLYLGQSSLLAFDENVAKASESLGTHVSLPQRELPGTPAWYRPGATVTPRNANAGDKVNLVARPARKPQGLGIEGDRFVATYFRAAVGLAATGGAVRWVATVPTDILGAGAAKGGFALCEASGEVQLVDARAGGVAGSVSLGKPLMACVVEPGGFQVPPGKDPGSLADQIDRTISVHETDMMAIQQFLLRELAADPDPMVTKTLLALASDARTAPTLLEDSRRMLAARRSGAEHMLAALERHYDFLDDVVRPPPVGPLADALGAMKEKRAAPLLAAHLNEPTNSTGDVRRAARALEVLATDRELPEVRTFFALYRATADDENMVSAVLSAAQVLMRVGGDVERELVQQAAKDPLTQPQIKQGLSGIAAKGG